MSGPIFLIIPIALGSNAMKMECTAGKHAADHSSWPHLTQRTSAYYIPSIHRPPLAVMRLDRLLKDENVLGIQFCGQLKLALEHVEAGFQEWKACRAFLQHELLEGRRLLCTWLHYFRYGE
ncbi:hypothetical protein OE88DRAFT_1648933 [Heliocybe sulcata]|uniref:Uncharacterized protein n=1 Tax=Heliocybe sulcata TaxID=5364 RepID=A0A5C3MKT6_9AGAM|nr:hypothetical protein OE88DRAFT_1648933 [Heliocybe sulcata]